MAAVEQVLDPRAPVEAGAPACPCRRRRQPGDRRARDAACGPGPGLAARRWSLPEEVWWQRHRVLLVIIALHVPVIVIREGAATELTGDRIGPVSL